MESEVLRSGSRHQSCSLDDAQRLWVQNPGHLHCTAWSIRCLYDDQSSVART